MKSVTLSFLCLLLLTASIQTIHAACENSGDIPDIALQIQVSGLQQPVYVTSPPNSKNQLFIVEQSGRIRIAENGKLLLQDFLDLRDRVDSGGEKGLLSLTFHPSYLENGLFYVNYTGQKKRKLHTFISEFSRTANNRADPQSERRLLEIQQPFSNHNGGQLQFGPDGYLYIGMGDGGSANDPYRHGQNLSTLLGKMLRIDVDKHDNNRAYDIPHDNPFVSKSGVRPEIWAYGLRNPWRFSFDSDTGALYVADVGQDHEEEINLVTRGGNYGWPIMEGKRCTPGINRRCDKTGLILPLWSYTHDEGTSITGGYVYRGQAIPQLCGAYIYADFVTRKIWALRTQNNKILTERLLLTAPFHLSSFGIDSQKELYVIDYEGGRVFKFIPQNAH